MPQFPSVIIAANLNGLNGFKLSGAVAYDQVGVSVSAAGDFNGDGFADVIVGATGADPHGTDSGASYIVFGKASGFAANTDLSTLNGSNGFKINGVAAGDFAGRVSSAGDINGDGFDDVIIGADTADPHGTSSGASYVIFGHASGFSSSFELSALDGVNGFKISGALASDHLGRSVASAGDINGDGFDDIVVGAFGADANGIDAGASYVVFGKASGFSANLDVTTINGTGGFKITGAVSGDSSGISVKSAGDVNNDGFADLIIGADGADPHGSLSGASYVVYGKASGFGSNINLSALNGLNGFKISGFAQSDYSGISVSSAGDVNGDGFDDVIIGASGADTSGTNAGAAYVVFGQAFGSLANVDLAKLDGSNGFRISGPFPYSGVGFSVSSAGDVNGDGFDDVIAGGPNLPLFNYGGVYVGVSYVVFGKASGFTANINGADLNGSNGFQIFGGTGTSDFLGGSVSDAGDINGDGFDDLIVGASQENPHGKYSGSSYVIFGVAPTTSVTRTGSDGSQTIHGGNFDDALSGLGGNDTLIGNGGDDSIDGGLGNDILHGGDGSDELLGSAGADQLFGDADNDQLDGGTGNDLLHGGAGSDQLIGGAGNDVLQGGAGDDDMDGGAGIDTADYSDAAAGVTVNLSNTDAQDTVGEGVDTLFRIENLTGSAFDDRLTGSAAANVLDGRSGADRINGGAGNDIIIGGAGRDVLSGGAGNDVFRYLSITETGTTGTTRDQITDFTAGADKIDLSAIRSAIDANADGVNDPLSFIGTAAFSHTPGELRFSVSGANTIVAGDVNGDGVNDFQILLSGTPALTAGDFML